LFTPLSRNPALPLKNKFKTDSLTSQKPALDQCPKMQLAIFPREKCTSSGIVDTDHTAGTMSSDDTAPGLGAQQANEKKLLRSRLNGSWNGIWQCRHRQSVTAVTLSGRESRGTLDDKIVPWGEPLPD
jgi:hypothetical protein